MIPDSGLESENYQFLCVECKWVVMRGWAHSTIDPDVVSRIELSDDIAELLCRFISGAVQLTTGIFDVKDDVSTWHDVRWATHLTLDNHRMIG